MFTKRHYESVATMVANLDTVNRPSIALALASIFEEDNPRFNTNEFLKACLVIPSAAFSAWIDTETIGKCVYDTLAWIDCKESFGNAKEVWLDFLENELSDGLEKSVIALKDRGAIE